MATSSDTASAATTHEAGRASAASAAGRKKPRLRRVGPYVLSGRTLGIGRNGPVFHAISRLDGLEVAVKIVRHKAGDDAIDPEVAALERVGRHPNIARLVDSCRTASGYDIIVTEAVGGGELLGLVERVGRVPEERAKVLLAGVVSGVLHMHSRGLAHRDLKLENLLLTEAGGSHVKIIDYDNAHFDPPAAAAQGCLGPALEPGLGRGRAPLSLTCSRVCGTSSYAAPEVISASRERRYDGKQADVWSLGVCIFALVLGIFPLEEASEEDEIGPRSPESRPSPRPSGCRAGASDKDPRFEALKRAQLENRSSVESILCLYRREDKLSPALTARDCPRLPEALLDGMLLVDPSTRLTMADVQASRWFRTLAQRLGDDPAPPRTPAAGGKSFGKSFGGLLRLSLSPYGRSSEDESSLTSPRSILDLAASPDHDRAAAGAQAPRAAADWLDSKVSARLRKAGHQQAEAGGHHRAASIGVPIIDPDTSISGRSLPRGQCEFDDEGDGATPRALAATPSTSSALASSAAPSPTAPTAPASAAASQRRAESWLHRIGRR
ncbi:hypothetical protein EMIHUDRAFT_470224 [Emiliania huxleyi CCMP1516]|uniref:Protein kinase domain-containing protein n=2 Tax=Emiliania huxleyi TaxID=2903 RepID=A0A0D3J509_EMIH1|nr:hypothetical protein EMIHUDRAFT_470224 [Emiliania huxleyi CCMP1516]EOD18594.1 hypothetical protein EMIHUDRAFT_470224 [Emiliania huxleyi CCMP1516]|eukprot:XP_005771023.1 hypothetical protein EMIHUDRAFT_470224 [Emiliania huxleyi CCMP1516]